MSHNFGFLVLPEERKGDGFDEGESGTVFVDVDTYPRSHQPRKIVANLYYRRNQAKWNLTTEEELRARFSKSYAQKDAGEEYDKLREV